MSGLTILREGWDLIEQEELRLLRAMTVQESLDHWLQLQKAFEWQLINTADLFEHQRHAALVELQSRLYRLVGGLLSYGELVPVHSDTPKTTEWR